MRPRLLLPLLLLTIAATSIVSASATHAAIRPIAEHPAIINGSVVPASTYDERWRFTVAVLSERGGTSEYCGGVLIDERTVLTAAHCTYWASTGSEVAATDMTIVVGQRVPSIGDGDSVGVASITRHPSFDDRLLTSDIAVVRLARRPSVPFSTIQPTSQADETWWGAGAGHGIGPDLVGPWIAGWGATSPSAGSPVAGSLHAAKVPIAADAACASPSAPGVGGYFVASSMVCAGVPGPTPGSGVDSCHGDSGGPLIVGDGLGRWRLVGLTSWGYACGGPTFGVYTRVGAFVTWIETLRFTPSPETLTPITQVPTGSTTTSASGSGPEPAAAAIGPVVISTPATTASRLARPTGLRVLARGRRTLVIGWRPGRATADAGRISYRVLSRTTRGWRVLAISSSPRTTVRSLVPGRAYRLCVQAIAPDGRRSTHSLALVVRTRGAR